MMKRSLLLATIPLVSGLDVKIKSYTCDESLPVTATIKMDCNGDDRCTFGKQITAYGKLNYNGVEDTGIEDNLAFITSDLSFWTLDFNLFDMLSVPLCDDTMTADENNANDCPGDGSYSYSVVYKLPNSGSDSASWLASGFEGSGFIRMYAEADESMMIGECILNLQTFMTETEESGLLRTPSAAAATGIALAVLAVVAMTCLYCYCCCRRRPDTRKQPRGNPEDSLESMFQRMEDEKSHYTRSTAAQSQRSSKGGASVLSGMGTVPIM